MVPPQTAAVLSLPDELLIVILQSTNRIPLSTFRSRSLNGATKLSSTCRALRARILALEPTLGSLHALFCNFLLLTPVVAGPLPVPALPPADDFDALDRHLSWSTASTQEEWPILFNGITQKNGKDNLRASARELDIVKFVTGEVAVLPLDTEHHVVVVPIAGTGGNHHHMFALDADGMCEESDGSHFSRYSFATTDPETARLLDIEGNLWTPLLEERWETRGTTVDDMGVFSDAELLARLSQVLHGLVFGKYSPEPAWSLADWQSWTRATCQVWNGISHPNWPEPTPDRPALSSASSPAAVPPALLSFPRLIDRVRKTFSLTALNNGELYPCDYAKHDFQRVQPLIRKTRANLRARHELGISLSDLPMPDPSPEACCYRAIVDQRLQSWQSNFLLMKTPNLIVKIYQDVSSPWSPDSSSETAALSVAPDHDFTAAEPLLLFTRSSDGESRFLACTPGLKSFAAALDLEGFGLECLAKVLVTLARTPAKIDSRRAEEGPWCSPTYDWTFLKERLQILGEEEVAALACDYLRRFQLTCCDCRKVGHSGDTCRPSPMQLPKTVANVRMTLFYYFFRYE
ncbi:hypothetical protein HDU87_005532 [Geranomyces variabilis]|uniref:Uncharacterized protein n=1 Tax=Geranomyces variabilis TaxID=109894 RepID=A0AAD5XLN1_9FUNG|nr:hypothetical protein HDU87_005532 [Geranomyces variabilis]